MGEHDSPDSTPRSRAADWIFAIGQAIVVAGFAAVVAEVCRLARTSAVAAKLPLPQISILYFFRLGPAGICIVAALAIVMMLCTVLIRARTVAALLSVAIFLAAMWFLLVGFVAALMPLLHSVDHAHGP